MKIKTGGTNFEPCPEYTGPAVCVDVTPLKTVQTQFGPKEKFRFVFETGQFKEDGAPWCVWSAPFTPSYHENSALRPFLRKWMGRELSPDEMKEFDTEELLGRTAHLTVIHEHGDGEVYANIALIQPDKAKTPLKASGKYVRAKDRVEKSGNGKAESGNTDAGARSAPPKQPAAPPAGRPVETPKAAPADLGATVVHVGRCKGRPVRDLSNEQLGALADYWLPKAKELPMPTAEDRLLMAALDAWASGQLVMDDVPF
jgi:hypothetical protein